MYVKLLVNNEKHHKIIATSNKINIKNNFYQKIKKFVNSILFCFKIIFTIQTLFIPEPSKLHHQTTSLNIFLISNFQSFFPFLNLNIILRHLVYLLSKNHHTFFHLTIKIFQNLLFYLTDTLLSMIYHQSKSFYRNYALSFTTNNLHIFDYQSKYIYHNLIFSY